MASTRTESYVLDAHVRGAPDRHSPKNVPRRERERVARDLKPTHATTDADAAESALETFDFRREWAIGSR